MHSLDHVREELESEVRAEQAIAEDPSNSELTLGTPRCIATNDSCLFIWIIIVCSSLIMH
jgi:hypothetical protein